MQELINKAKQVKCIICDVDGVLTNGHIFIDSQGNSLKAFHVHDGMGLKLLMNAGIKVAVITSSNSQAIDFRMRELGITHFFKGCKQKDESFLKIKEEFGFSNNEFAYVGDDLPDLSIIRQVGFGVAVANSVKEVKEFATFITTQNGGNGAVREVCDFILYAQDKYKYALDEYFNT